MDQLHLTIHDKKIKDKVAGNSEKVKLIAQSHWNFG